MAIENVWLRPVNFSEYQGGFTDGDVEYRTSLHQRQWECRNELNKMIRDRQERTEIISLLRGVKEVHL